MRRLVCVIVLVACVFVILFTYQLGSGLGQVSKSLVKDDAWITLLTDSTQTPTAVPVDPIQVILEDIYKRLDNIEKFLPDFEMDQENKTNSDHNVNSFNLSLGEVLREASGLFNDIPGAAYAPQPGVVLFTVGDFGFLDMIMNWACWVEMYNMKFFLWAMDDKIHRELIKRGKKSYFSESDQFEYSINNTWKISGYTKMFAILRILSLGYDVFVSDADIIFVNNPWIFFSKDVDLEYQTETMYGEGNETSDLIINVGFFLCRSNPRTISLFNETLRHPSVAKGREDQEVVNTLVREWKGDGRAEFFKSYDPPLAQQNRDVLTYRMKSTFSHPSGGIVFHTIRRNRYLKQVSDGVVPVIVHANLVHGRERKIGCFKAFGYWKYNEENGTCLNTTIDYTTTEGCRTS